MSAASTARQDTHQLRTAGCTQGTMAGWQVWDFVATSCRLIGCDAPHCSPMPSVVGSIVPVMITVSVLPVGMDVLVTAGLFTVTSSDRLPLAFTRRTCTMPTLSVCPRDTDHDNTTEVGILNNPIRTASSSQYILWSGAPRRQGGCQA